MCFKRVKKNSDVIVRYGMYVMAMYIALALVLLIYKCIIVSIALFIIAILIYIYIRLRLKIIKEILTVAHATDREDN